MCHVHSTILRRGFGPPAWARFSSIVEAFFASRAHTMHARCMRVARVVALRRDLEKPRKNSVLPPAVAIFRFCRAHAPKRVSPRFFSHETPVGRSSLRTAGRSEETSPKPRFRARKSRPEAPGGPSGRGKSTSDGPSRAENRVRSASGASEFFLFGANEETSSEKARPVPPRSERAPEASED